MRPTRRQALTGAAALAIGGGLASCRGGGDGDGLVIDYGWWGSPEKDDAVFAAIDAFEAATPDIQVEGEATPWDGYWDKLATMSAGGSPPDVIHMSERYILEYGERDALVDLRDLDGIDVDTLDEMILGLGESGDGALYAVPAGLNTFILAANVDLFNEAGVDLPDDSTWTWSDFYEISAALAESGIVGAGYGFGIESFRPWLHQHDETMYNEDGTAAGFSPEVLVSYLEHLLTMREHGGPTADQVSEYAAVPSEAGLFSTGQQGMEWVYSNTLGERSEAAGAEMRLLRIPSQTGAAADAGMYYKGSEFYSISAHSDPEQQAAAAQFVDFMVNSSDAIQEIGMIMGVPPNTEVVEEISDDLDEIDQYVQEFVTDLQADLTVEAPGPSPIGSGNIQGIFDRDVLEMLYDRATPEETAEKIIQGINSELG
ncbi:MAG TPA: extracellular solute-binding protein [Jiangellaceae bacterium]|nr:extracellular solute-binding protein [Jiangellaceae bacterium]